MPTPLRTPQTSGHSSFRVSNLPLWSLKSPPSHGSKIIIFYLSQSKCTVFAHFLHTGEKAVFFLALSALLEFSLSRTARWAGILLLLVGALHGGTIKGRLQHSSLIRSYLHHLANSSSVHLT